MGLLISCKEKKESKTPPNILSETKERKIPPNIVLALPLIS